MKFDTVETIKSLYGKHYTTVTHLKRFSLSFFLTQLSVKSPGITVYNGRRISVNRPFFEHYVTTNIRTK